MTSEIPYHIAPLHASTHQVFLKHKLPLSTHTASPRSTTARVASDQLDLEATYGEHFKDLMRP